MKPGNPLQGVAWYLGTIQYGVFLFGGGALWFLAARLTGFFWGDLGAQVVACLLLLGADYRRSVVVAHAHARQPRGRLPRGLREQRGHRRVWHGRGAGDPAVAASVAQPAFPV